MYDEQAPFIFLISKNRREQTLTISLQNGESPFFSLGEAAEVKAALKEELGTMARA